MMLMVIIIITIQLGECHMGMYAVITRTIPVRALQCSLFMSLGVLHWHDLCHANSIPVPYASFPA